MLKEPGTTHLLSETLFVGEFSTGLCSEVFNTSVLLLSQAPGSANVTYCNTHILLPLHRWLISWPFPNADSLQQTALSYRNTHLLILLTSIKSWPRQQMRGSERCPSFSSGPKTIPFPVSSTPPSREQRLVVEPHILPDTTQMPTAR